MTYGSQSGDSDPGVTIRTPIGNHSRANDLVLEAYAPINQQSGTSHYSVIKKRAKPLTDPHDSEIKLTQARNELVSRKMRYAHRALAKMKKSVGEGDLIDLSVVGFELREVLQDLWEIRGQQDNDWGDLLNLIQTAIALEEFERFTLEMVVAVADATSQLDGPVGIEEIEKAIEVLGAVGLDPFGAISGDTDEEENQ